MTHRPRRLWRTAALFLLSAVAVAACSGGDSDDAAEDVATDTSTTTTEVVEVSTTVAETTTTEPASPIYPLTGMPADADDADGPALVIKIDNHGMAQPQWGINQADIVYEEIVEARITRLAAVFQSEDADPVGPVRSARTSDFNILNNLGTPLFGNSGGNESVMSMLRSVDMVPAGQGAMPDLYFRESSRPRPHNLLTNTSEIFAAAPDEAGTPPVQYAFRSSGDELPEDARVVEGVDLDYGGLEATYRWDAGEAGWLRSQHGEPMLDTDDVQVAPENVIIQFIDYGRSPADPRSPEAQLVGEGVAWVLTDGHLIEGRWSRPDPSSVTTFTTAGGAEIALTPGKTWVALPREGMATIVE